MTKATLLQNLLLGLLLAGALISHSQTFSPGLAAKFGIDGDISSDTRQNGNFSAAGSHDWFKAVSGTGPGLFDTLSAAAYKSQLQAGANIVFSKRLRYARYAVLDSVILMDACYARDYQGNDRTSFSGNGTKNTASPLVWGTSPGGSNVSDKTDIIDSYVSMRRGGTSISSVSPSNLVATMALSTLATGGDRYADFEFYRERINYNAATGKFENSGPAPYGGHSVWEFNTDGAVKNWGDMTISFTFNGSTVSDVKVYIWVAQAMYQSVNPIGFDFLTNEFHASTAATGYGYAAIRPDNGQIVGWGSVNTASTSAPLWGTNSKDLGNNGNNYFSLNYAAGQFAEAAVDLTALGMDPATFMNMNACNPPFTRFMTKSRSSSSFSSSLSDFNGPFEFLDVPVVAATITNPGMLTCAKSSLALSPALYLHGAFYNWTTANGNVVGSNADSSSVVIDKPGKYYLTAAINKGCAASVDSVVVTEDMLRPKATAAVSDWLYAGQSVTLYGGDTAMSNHPAPFGSQGLLWDWNGPIGFASSLQNPQVSAPGFYTLIVTEKRNGCRDTALVYVVPYPSLPVRFTAFNVKRNLVQKQTRLQWSLAKGSHAVAFLVERSRDGTVFSTLAKVPFVTDREANEYLDLNPAGEMLYRVGAIEAGGRIAYSDVVREGSGTPQTLLAVNRQGNLSVTLYAGSSGLVTLQLLNASGQLLLSERRIASEGRNDWNLLLAQHVSPGLYILRVEERTGVTTLKLPW